MTWKQTYTGRAVDLLAPRAEDVDFADVAHALALINRYDGHTDRPISVAQHCVMGAAALYDETGSTRLAALFLLHDAHEAYLGDLGQPVQMALYALCPDARRAWQALKFGFDAAIHIAAGLMPPSSAEEKLVKAMDLRMLRAERDALMGPRPRDWMRAVEDAAPIPSLPNFVTWPAGVRYPELRYSEALRRWCPLASARAA